MTTAVQLRRGTTAEHATFTGLEGETTVDTTKSTLVVHNGSTAGGFAIAREDLANVSPTNLPSITGGATAADDTFLIYDQSALTLKKITRAELNNAIEQDPLSNVQIISGTINGTTIGGTTAAAGSFTTLNSSGATTLNGTTIPSSVTLVSTAATQTLTNKTLTSPTINTPTLAGGTINNTSIGATTASTGAFTNLSYTGTLTGGTGVVNLGSGQFYKDASGNVGIGTSSPVAPLHVEGNVTISRPAGSNVALSLTADNNTTSSRDCTIVFSPNNIAGTTTPTSEILATSSGNGQGVLAFLTRPGSGSRVERMRITSAGNVGIGTSSPSTALEVNGTITVPAAADAVARSGLSVGNGTVQAQGTSAVGTTATIINSSSSFHRGGLALVRGRLTTDVNGVVFLDLVLHRAFGGITVIQSGTVNGSPAARTYSSLGSGNRNLRLAMAADAYNIELIYLT